MKILFVCKANAERSQVAAEFFNALSKNYRAVSAGVRVKRKELGFPPGITISEIMLSSGYYNILRKRRKQLKKKMAMDADIIVVFLLPLELKFLPDYLKTMKNVRYWDLGTLGKEYHLNMVLKIRSLVEKLVKETSNTKAGNIRKGG